jgi:hypothetical protein
MIQNGDIPAAHGASFLVYGLKLRQVSMRRDFLGSRGNLSSWRSYWELAGTETAFERTVAGTRLPAAENSLGNVSASLCAVHVVGKSSVKHSGGMTVYCSY